MEPTEALVPPAVSAPPPGLAARARAAYLRGRLRLAARALFAAGLVPVGAVLLGRGHGMLVSEDLALTCACACGFLLLAPALAFFGRAPGDAVRPGLGAAVLATYSPLLMRAIGHACGSSACMSLCLPACVAGGLLAGGLLSWRALGQATAGERAQTLLAGGALVLLAAPMGCAVLGFSGLVAVTAGLAAGSLPALAPRAA